MRKITKIRKSFLFFVTSFLVLTFQNAAAQQAEKTGQPLPADVNKFVSNSCTPCHTDKGGFMSKSALNFDDWTKMTSEKQNSKAEKIADVVEKGKMPPKGAREKRPEIVPTKEQIAMVQKWAESVKPAKK